MALTTTINVSQLVRISGGSERDSSPRDVSETCSAGQSEIGAKLDRSSHSWPAWNGQLCFRFQVNQNCPGSSGLHLYITSVSRGYGGPVSGMRASIYEENPAKPRHSRGWTHNLEHNGENQPIGSWSASRVIHSCVRPVGDCACQSHSGCRNGIRSVFGRDDGRAQFKGGM